MSTTTPLKLRILVVDDEERTAGWLRETLEPPGILARLTRVSEGTEALACLHGVGEFSDRTLHPLPNLVFMECRIPVFSGVAVLCCLRSESRFRQLPVVMLSRRFSPGQSETLTRLRAAWCEKGSSVPQVLEAMARSIRLVAGSELKGHSEGRWQCPDEETAVITPCSSRRRLPASPIRPDDVARRHGRLK